jgi:dihydropteroate synthase
VIELQFRGRTVVRDHALVMAIINRTPDSFYDKGATYAEDVAMEAVHRVVDEGADIVDIGGVKAGPGDLVDSGEEVRRVVPFIARVRAAYPELIISSDTWRADVGRLACEAGADRVAEPPFSATDVMVVPSAMCAVPETPEIVRPTSACEKVPV